MDHPIKRLFLDVEGARLCCVDFGGEGQPVLLLHGLAGRANEWREMAACAGGCRGEMRFISGMEEMGRSHPQGATRPPPTTPGSTR